MEEEELLRQQEETDADYPPVMASCIWIPRPPYEYNVSIYNERLDFGYKK